MGALSPAMGGYRVREVGLYDYCTGLLLDVARKSVEPIAAQIAPERVSAKHQSLLHFVGQSEWCGERLIGAVCAQVLPGMELREKICAWIIDDTGFVKKGVHSVGVGRQYCGQVGKKENCQIAVSLSVANHDFSLPVAFQLYLPKDWAEDGEPHDWHTVTWREGSNSELTSRFACARVTIAHRHQKQKQPRPQEWLLIEWPEGDEAPIKYWLSNLPPQPGLEELVDTVKLRWRIERDYLELKQEVGLNHYEGRSWRGFHHHVALCIAAYGFLICQQAAISPSGPTKAEIIAQFALSKAPQKPAATRKTAKA